MLTVHSAAYRGQHSKTRTARPLLNVSHSPRPLVGLKSGPQRRRRTWTPQRRSFLVSQLLALDWTTSILLCPQRGVKPKHCNVAFPTLSFVRAVMKDRVGKATLQCFGFTPR